MGENYIFPKLEFSILRVFVKEILDNINKFKEGFRGGVDFQLTKSNFSATIMDLIQCSHRSMNIQSDPFMGWHPENFSLRTQ
ncbi:MAG TPA: hypothetical protein DEA86_10100 [Deltaproteobacteria bacterium]|nr:hypothetical protein [Deltaproteobacteria bacterium]HBR60767.1 hypothetical protein [Deltaproteobacteria bacterium]